MLLIGGTIGRGLESARRYARSRAVIIGVEDTAGVEERVGIKDGVRNGGERLVGVGSDEGVWGCNGEWGARGMGAARVEGIGEI